jgi:hypothetical protein
MDFYGFSNSIEQANQLAQASSLANSAYNLYNAGAEDSWRQNQYNALQPTIDADKQRGKTDDARVEKEEIEQGGGTAVGFGGVIALGKGVKDTTNKVSKAIRIGEAQLEIARKSGNAADIAKASKLLDVAKSGKLSEFSKVAAQYVGERALGKTGAANVNRIVNLAQDINRGTTSYGSAARTVLTREGRQAANIINQRATEIAEQAELPDEPEADAGGDIAERSNETQADIQEPEPQPEALQEDTNVEPSNPAEVAEAPERSVRASGETSVSTGEEVADATTEGGGRAASVAAQRAVNPTPDEEADLGIDMDSDGNITRIGRTNIAPTDPANTAIAPEDVGGITQGVEGRPDTFQTSQVSEQQFGDLYEDPREELRGFEDEGTNPDALIVGRSDDAGGIYSDIIDGGATNLTAQTRYMAVGTESTGFRGLAGTIGQRIFGRQIDLTAGVDNPLADVDEATELGRNVGTSRNVAQSVSVLGNQENPTETVSNLAQTADETGDVATGATDATRSGLSLAQSTETPASRAARALAGLQGQPQPQAVDESGEPARATDTNAETGQATNQAELTDPAEQTTSEAPRASGTELDIANEATPEAVSAGTAANQAAIEEGGGIDTRALEVGAQQAADYGGVAGAVGKIGLKGVGALGQGMKILGPAANVLFLGDQSYDELSSMWEGHGLSGDGTVGKVGGVMQEVGDAAATYGSYLALAGPVGDVAALGVELGGGAVALVGDLLSDLGTKDKEEKEKQEQQQQQQADEAKQKATLSAQNQAVEIAGAAGSANLAGRGSVAQVSRSAIRAF